MVFLVITQSLIRVAQARDLLALQVAGETSAAAEPICAQPGAQMVVPMVSGVTAGLTPPGVILGLGRELWAEAAERLPL